MSSSLKMRTIRAACSGGRRLRSPRTARFNARCRTDLSTETLSHGARHASTRPRDLILGLFAGGGEILR